MRYKAPNLDYRAIAFGDASDCRESQFLFIAK